jgi:hydantoinase/carbamoylase family amidase
LTAGKCPQIDAARVIADLRELDRRTGGPGGARRLAWTDEWREARALLGELLSQIGISSDRDEAGNVWARLEGDEEPAVAIGSHLDSVPSGGWLDGALGVLAAAGVMRSWVSSGQRPPRSLALVDWADEEGARFGHSLFGSSAFSGTFDAPHAGELCDQTGQRLADVVAADGVDSRRALEAGRRRARLGCYLELHIEQGPVLERRGLRAAAVSGCVGIERHRCRFIGQTGHAGTTPMTSRRDAGLAACAAALELEQIAVRCAGTATTGSLTLRPGIPTAVPGEAEMLVDVRHAEAAQLHVMLQAVLGAARAAADTRRCGLRVERVWGIAPIEFDETLVVLAREACAEIAGSDFALRSGALHDAAEVARVLPVAMIFAPSRGGISHAPEEDTSDADLTAAIETFDRLCTKVLISRGPIAERVA